jgi:hypothetical protein
VKIVRKSERFFAVFLIFLSGLFYSVGEVLADIPVPPRGNGTVISADTLVAAGIVVLVIAVLSYLLLRRIRKGRKKDADK